MLKDLVLRVLNQTVGEYFENIDASQLQLSVFSGNIALHDLVLKRNICESLGLPFRVISGRCANLNLKIPWTGLNSHPVEVDIRDIYLLVVPGSSLPYDEEVEEKARLRLKLQLLENIEAAQKELTSNEHATEPGYFEKLGMQIVKNLQIRVESIHLRYEDEYTNPSKNFAIGLVLSKLSILTTNSEWIPRYVYDKAATVHKLLSLEGFALYWNCNSLMVSKAELDVDARVERLKEILKRGKFDSLFGPISIVTKVRLAINPEKGPKPFTVPKILFDTVVEELAIGISNLQFQDMLHMAASWEGIYRMQYYRKYRPHGKAYKGNYRLWWRFAYNCILEDIQRRRNNWRWIRMLHHRRDCKQYHKVLYSKNILKKTNPQMEAEIEALENRLDIFNILLIRKQIDLFRARRSREEEKLLQEQSWCDWFRSWVVPSPEMEAFHSPQEPITPDDMSSEEKRALLVAIGFTDATNLVVLHTPPDYVDAHVDFRLDKLKVIITQDDRRWNVRRSVSEGTKSTIMDLQITRCELALDSRPINHGLKVTFKLESIDVYGGDAPEDEDDDEGSTPHIVAPRRAEGVSNLLDVVYEQAPLNSEFDQRLRVHGHPLDITYDSATVHKLIACFTLPKHVALQRLQSKAMLTYKQLKARSSTSLRRIMESHEKFEMDIHLEAPCLIIPQFGFSPTTLNVIVVELGELIITSQLLQI
ncbi:vacuolar protein sorting-associated protein 13-like [Folsomia candida]|uniref:vacuolar protein sorting-associated protein 13-like n=1 Tax=Folsomia candida TaxID=158441 RepID=UPI001604EDA1|nr:vacuolar protein sorting-associated protein 13-like [Folsomia candida]